ncbi:MAG: hypothetical protein KF802_03305 [Bdellovibrionaceae bacterium]|nr:hypothetical protein [Pseudobdellovibrionaceae bacterium]MBX3033352.1 hypothetical protein [Pseudobdellovibrionaceae bacterium]
MRFPVGVLLGSLTFAATVTPAAGPRDASPGTDHRLQTRLSAPAPAAAPDWVKQWRMELSGRDFDSRETSTKLVNFRFDLQLKYRLSEDVLLKIAPAARLQSGATQSSDGRLSPENKIYFREASALWRAGSFALLKAGALDMGETHSPLLLDPRPFPAARAQISYGDGDWRLSLLAEGAVPTTVGLNTNQGEKEPTPVFQSYSLRHDWKSGPLWKGMLRAGAFAFSALPTSLANDSRLLGNTVDTVSDTESRFRERYAGVEAQGELRFPLPGPVDGRLRASHVRNTSAPDGFNQASQFAADLTWRWDTRRDLLLGAEAFRAEPDAAVASFVQDAYSGTNRAGYRVDAGIAFGKRKAARLVGGAGESQLIYQNSPQSRERFVIMKLETDYADF